MCYGCKPLCENCKPKFVSCPACGYKNFLASVTCFECGGEIPEQAKDEARRVWALKSEKATKGRGKGGN